MKEKNYATPLWLIACLMVIVAANSAVQLHHFVTWTKPANEAATERAIDAAAKANARDILRNIDEKIKAER